MKILVTGPTGFIGAAFLRAALARGHVVAGLLYPGAPLPKDLEGVPGVEWFSGSLADTPWPEIARFAPDVCLHTAWVTTPGVYLESPENRLFLEWSLAFLGDFRRFCTNRIMVLGTCIEYQPADTPLSEEKSSVVPTTLYARCKSELRQQLENDGGFDLAWGRVFYPYGPGEHSSRLCSSLCRALANGEKPVLKTPYSIKDYIFITDLASAIMTVIEKRYRGVINLGTGIGIAVEELAALLACEMGRPGLFQKTVVPETDFQDRMVADAARLYRLGWTPAVSLPEGIKKLVASLQSSPKTRRT